MAVVVAFAAMVDVVVFFASAVERPIVVEPVS